MYLPPQAKDTACGAICCIFAVACNELTLDTSIPAQSKTSTRLAGLKELLFIITKYSNYNCSFVNRSLAISNKKVSERTTPLSNMSDMRSIIYTPKAGSM